MSSLAFTPIPAVSMLLTTDNRATVTIWAAGADRKGQRLSHGRPQFGPWACLPTDQEAI